MNRSDSSLNFSPITDGLGFHPFSDGLPYAPVTKASKSIETPRYSDQARYSTGAGAVAAGAPTFARDVPRPARVSVPRSATVSPAAGPAAQTQAVAPQVEARYGVLYMLKRVLAYLLDTALNTAICAAALSTVLVRQDLNPETLLSSSVVVLFSLFLVFFNWALVTAQEVAFGTTVGKRIFGLVIRGSTSATFLRAFFFLPSLGFAGLGVLLAVFDRKRRCWHDVVVDLQPTEVARL